MSGYVDVCSWLEDEFDYLSETWDQAVKNACYYFATRF